MCFTASSKKCLLELDAKPVKGNISVAFRITVLLFERQMDEDKVQPL